MSQIQIVQPLDSAWSDMVRMLFQPFSWRKWFGLGFCAFLAELLSGGSSGSFSPEPDSGSGSGTPFWNDPVILTVILAVALIVVAVLVVLTWLSCRGKFMFLDGVVHNRGLVVHPWKEFTKEARSLFFFTLIYSLAVLSGIAIIGLSAWFAFTNIGAVYDIRIPQHLLVTISFAVVVILFTLSVWLVSYAVRDFIVPTMYRERIRFVAATRRFFALLTQYPVEFIYYTLLRAAVGIICVFVIFIGICATCCIAAIPYISSVVFLPVLVLIRLYPLHFLAQFGADWNILATADTLPPPPPPAENPPVTTV